jgi:Flp pilus assembly secretin CpaC
VLDLDGPAEAEAFAAIAKPHGGLVRTLAEPNLTAVSGEAAAACWI